MSVLVSCLYARLKINLSKSGLASINIDSQDLSSTTSLAGCQILEWPLVYSSVPMDDNLICFFLGSCCGKNFQASSKLKRGLEPHTLWQ